MDAGKILIVEDEAFIAHDMKRILDASGYHVIIDCFNVDTAIRLIQNEQPDLVLIDINLGERKSGLDLAEYLNKIAGIPYIFITSYSDEATLRKVAAHSPSGYINKPFKSQDLIASVFLALNKKPIALADKAKTKEIPFAITQILDYIRQNIGEKLDVKTLAALTDWESEHFGRIFKEHVGLTPYQYVLKAKMDRAKELLSQTDETLLSISFQLGFATYGSFFLAFRKHVSMSPDHYRKLMR